MVGVAVWCAGCVPAPFATLDAVLVDLQPEPRPAAPSEYGRVQVTREGQSANASPQMAIQKGDSVRTSSDGVGVIVLAAGYEVILDPGTDITIENPSIFVRIGRIIVKKLAEVKAALTVKTDIGAAAVEGTQFVFEVRRDRSAAITVIEGQVKMYPIGRRGWDTVRYRGGQRGGWMAGGQRLTLPDSASPAEIGILRQRISSIDRHVRIRTVSRPRPPLRVSVDSIRR